MPPLQAPPHADESTLVFWLRSVLRALWIARISVASVALGWLLFLEVQQAQDLFLDGRPWYQWLLFYVCLAVFWLIPVHHSARTLLHLNSAYIGANTPWRFFVLVELIPRTLVLAALLAVAAGQYLALKNIAELPPAPGSAAPLVAERIYRDGVIWLGVTIALLALTAIGMCATRLKANASQAVKRKFPHVVGLSFYGAHLLFGSSYVIPPDEDGRIRPPFFGARAFKTETVETFLAVVTLMLIFVVCAAFFLLNPLSIPTWIGRATMMVIMLGAWIPLLHILTFLSWRFQLPIAFGVLACFALMGSIVYDNHDLRLLDPSAGAAEQIDLRTAVDHWKKANCEYQSGVETCARPIIVAAEGGASRSAFFVASLLGRLQDWSMKPGNAKRRLDQQIFAISGVSGGALGAAAYVAAVHADHAGKFPASLAELPGEDLSFLTVHPGQGAPATGEPATATARPSYQSLLERFLAGDFLTPTIVRLGFGDFFRFYWTNDRAAILEQSWEGRWRLLEGGAADSPGLFEAPLHTFIPTSERWLPLLVLNGTSTVNGRRIITSTLQPWLPDNNEHIFTDSVDLNELRCAEISKSTSFKWKLFPSAPTCACAQKTDVRSVPSCDIRLSTAVTNSARFPYISPRGNIRSAAGEIVDYVVDGGHFDFFGIVTAVELTRHLQDLDLDPFLLLISSDPELDPVGCAQQNQPACDKIAAQRSPKLAWLTPRATVDERGDATLFPSVAGPFSTLMQTRVSRSFHEAWTAGRYLQESIGLARVCPSYKRVQCFDQSIDSQDPISAKSLSMSWWLSNPTLAYLDQQVGAKHNEAILKAVKKLLGEAPVSPPPAGQRGLEDIKGLGRKPLQFPQ